MTRTPETRSSWAQRVVRAAFGVPAHPSPSLPRTSEGSKSWGEVFLQSGLPGPLPRAPRYPRTLNHNVHHALSFRCQVGPRESYAGLGGGPQDRPNQPLGCKAGALSARQVTTPCASSPVLVWIPMCERTRQWDKAPPASRGAKPPSLTGIR